MNSYILGTYHASGETFLSIQADNMYKFYKTLEGVYKYQKMSVISHGFWHSSKVNLPVIAWVCPFGFAPLKILCPVLSLGFAPLLLLGVAWFWIVSD